MSEEELKPFHITVVMAIKGRITVLSQLIPLSPNSHEALDAKICVENIKTLCSLISVTVIPREHLTETIGFLEDAKAAVPAKYREQLKPYLDRLPFNLRAR